MYAAYQLPCANKVPYSLLVLAASLSVVRVAINDLCVLCKRKGSLYFGRFAAIAASLAASLAVCCALSAVSTASRKSPCEIARMPAGMFWIIDTTGGSFGLIGLMAPSMKRRSFGGGSPDARLSIS